MRTAFLYLANILGSAAGSVLTGFVLMDHLGLVDVGAALVVAGSALHAGSDSCARRCRAGTSSRRTALPSRSLSWPSR